MASRLLRPDAQEEWNVRRKTAFFYAALQEEEVKQEAGEKNVFP